MIGAGTLRDKVIIQRAVTFKNEFGEREESWTDLYVTRASFTGIKGREFFAAQQNNNEITVPITVRYREPLKPSDRVLFGTRVFEILSVVNVSERDRKLILNCRELNPE